MSETTGMEAKTLHRTLEFDPSQNNFRYNQENKLDTDLIILDEHREILKTLNNFQNNDILIEINPSIDRLNRDENNIIEAEKISNLSIFKKGIKGWQVGKFAAALEYFQQVTRQNSTDTIASLYVERCREKLGLA